MLLGWETTTLVFQTLKSKEFEIGIQQLEILGVKKLKSEEVMQDSSILLLKTRLNSFMHL